MGKRTENPSSSIRIERQPEQSDATDRDSRSWIDWLFPSRIERALLLAVYLVGAFYLVLFKVIAIILIVIVRSGGKAR